MSRLAFFLLLGNVILSGSICAHELRPGYIQIDETSVNQYAIQWRYPTSLPAGALPALVMPQTCTATTAAVQSRFDEAFVGRELYACEAGLAGHVLRLEYPVMNPSITTLFHLATLDGSIRNHVMKPGDDSWQIPEQESFRDVARDYLYLGIEHILIGWDHLLFVACLIFIARTARRIVYTITGFTIAHSITLALSTLQVVQLPVAPVEAAIALSIVFLAHEIAVNNRESWTWRHPVLVSSTFGLLHGFGFAAVLRDIGLPRTELPTALLFFNLGVEAGQIIFVLLVAVVLVVARQIDHTARLVHRHQPAIQLGCVYLIGTVAGFWLIDRVTGFF